jgi:DNA-binding CsgD family transcriptional regulator
MDYEIKLPYAKSEPYNEWEEVISTLYWYAAQFGELTEKEEMPEESTPFQRLLMDMNQQVEQDPVLSRLLDSLPGMIGNGSMLPAVFNAVFAQPIQPMAVQISSEDSDKLGKRELAALREMAKGSTRKQIARTLKIQESTVRTVFSRVYQKLGVDNQVAALVKANALGLISWSFFDFLAPLRHDFGLEYNMTEYVFLGAVDHWPDEEQKEAIRRWVRLGLLILLLGPMPQYVRNIHRGIEHTPQRSLFIEMTPEGKGIGDPQELKGLRGRPMAMAEAPKEAERHGFTPGHFYVAMAFTSPNPMNPILIAEVTREGRLIREFTGGSYCTTNLRNCFGLLFTQQGTLLIATANSLLEFYSGGRAVRHFARRVPYGPPVRDRMGRIYCICGWEHEAPICIFNSDGSLRRKIPTNPKARYTGLTVDEDGIIYAYDPLLKTVAIWNSEGKSIATFAGQDLNEPFRARIDPRNRLYILDGGVGLGPPKNHAIQVFDSHRRIHLHTICEPLNTEFADFLFLPNGHLLVLAAER